VLGGLPSPRGAISAHLLRCTLVANGTKRTFDAAQQMVAFEVKADMAPR